MGGAAKNRTGAIFHQHEIGDMNRQGDGPVKRMNRLQACVKATFFSCFNRRFRSAKLGAFGNKIGGSLVSFAYILCKWMIGSHGNK